MARSEDPPDELEFDLDREPPATQFLATPEDSLEFDLATLPPVEEPPPIVRGPRHSPSAALSGPVFEIELTEPAIPGAALPLDLARTLDTARARSSLPPSAGDSLGAAWATGSAPSVPLPSLDSPPALEPGGASDSVPSLDWALPESDASPSPPSPSAAAPSLRASPAPRAPHPLPEIPELEVGPSLRSPGAPTRREASSAHRAQRPPPQPAGSPSSTARSSAARSSAAQPSAARSGAAQPSAARSGAAQPSPPRAGGVATSVATRPSAAQPHTTRPTRPSARPDATRPSVAPRGLGLASHQHRAVQPPGFEHGSGLDLVGFDELERGGSHAAQLEVAVPIASNDDIPWPTGRTPSDDELTVDSHQLRAASGLAGPPGGLLATPLYALHVFRTLRSLKHKEGSARKALAHAEGARDELLARVARHARSKLATSERFLPLYEAADRHLESILSLERALKEANLEGSSELSVTQHRLDQLTATEREQQLMVDDHRVRADQAVRELERARAQLRRLDILERNLEQREERAPRSTDFDRHFSQLTRDREDLNDKLRGLMETQRATAFELRQAEDQLRRTAAERKATEGQKEGILISLEGELYQHSVAYDAAKRAHQGSLADIGRAICELRGHVQVDTAMREKLLTADAAVYQAAHQLKATLLAKTAMDADAYAQGKTLIVLALVVFLLLVVYLLW